MDILRGRFCRTTCTYTHASSGFNYFFLGGGGGGGGGGIYSLSLCCPPSKDTQELHASPTTTISSLLNHFVNETLMLTHIHTHAHTHTHTLTHTHQVDTQWSDIMTNLSQMSILEPVLIKQMLTNVATELGGIESALPGLRKRGLDLEEVEGSWHECQVRTAGSGGRSLRAFLWYQTASPSQAWERG